MLFVLLVLMHISTIQWCNSTSVDFRDSWKWIDYSDGRYHFNAIQSSLGSMDIHVLDNAHVYNDVFISASNFIQILFKVWEWSKNLTVKWVFQLEMEVWYSRLVCYRYLDITQYQKFRHGIKISSTLVSYHPSLVSTVLNNEEIWRLTLLLLQVHCIV